MWGTARAGLAIAIGLLLGLSPAPAAQAAASRPPAGPVRGWVVDRVRIENLEPDGSVSAHALGDFRGALDVVPVGGAVAVVNEVSVEDYLRGVAEVPTSWPVEALRAQAIAARTFALHEMSRDPDSAARAVGADICATDSCQVYIGLGKERQEKGARWVEAVESTRGQVILYRGEPILAKYSSSNGGRSVAGGRPYLTSVIDPDSARGPYGHWTVTLGYGQLSSLFGLPGPLASLRRTGDAVALDWAVPGGPSGQSLVPVPAFRDRLNADVPPQNGLPRTVPSTQFSVLADDQTGTATLDGRGHGHGVGMSQFGALGKAGRGLRAGDILASYYGGLRPVTIPPDQLPPAIRVALDTARGAVTVGATGRFRVLDGSGAPLAVVASGAWRVLPAGRGRVRVVPPADQETMPAVEALAARGPDAAGSAGGVTFRLSAPANVRVRVEGTALPAPVETVPALVDAGEAAIALPALPGPGRYLVVVLADAGAGRVTTQAATLRVRSSAPAGAARRLTAGTGSPTDFPRPAAAAWALLLAVVVGTTRLHRRRSGPRPHARPGRRRPV